MTSANLWQRDVPGRGHGSGYHARADRRATIGVAITLYTVLTIHDPAGNDTNA